MGPKVAVGVAVGVAVAAAVAAALGFQGRAIVVGMDLGTTYSTAAYRAGHDGVRVANVGGVDGRATASVVALRSDGTFVVGAAAAAAAAAEPWTAVFDAKRVLGRRSDEAAAAAEVARHGGRLVRHPRVQRDAFGKVRAACAACEPEYAFLVKSPAGAPHGTLATTCLDAGSVVAAAELAAVSPDAAAAVAAAGAAAAAPAYVFVTPTAAGCMVVETLMAAVAREVGHRSFKSAVVTIPADFSSASRQCTVDAYARAGIVAHRVLHEPAAAAIAYGLHLRPAVKYVLVFDMGGGTLDVSVLFMQAAAITVIGAAGDGHLGGEDFDDCIMGVMAAAGAACGSGALRAEAERVKIALGNASTPSVPWACAPATGVLSRDAFTAACAPLFDRVMQPVRDGLDAANVAPEEVDEVVLIGGSSRLLHVQHLLADYFHRPLHHTIDPDLAVAIGAATVID